MLVPLLAWTRVSSLLESSRGDAVDEGAVEPVGAASRGAAVDEIVVAGAAVDEVVVAGAAADEVVVCGAVVGVDEGAVAGAGVDEVVVAGAAADEVVDLLLWSRLPSPPGSCS